eukprot:1152256-Pelagomonas_calceolata.AAC.1
MAACGQDSLYSEGNSGPCRRAIENKNTSHSQVLEFSAPSSPPDPHLPFSSFILWWRGLTALLS